MTGVINSQKYRNNELLAQARKEGFDLSHEVDEAIYKKLNDNVDYEVKNGTPLARRYRNWLRAIDALPGYGTPSHIPAASIIELENRAKSEPHVAQILEVVISECANERASQNDRRINTKLRDSLPYKSDKDTLVAHGEEHGITFSSLEIARAFEALAPLEIVRMTAALKQMDLADGDVSTGRHGNRAAIPETPVTLSAAQFKELNSGNHLLFDKMLNKIVSVHQNHDRQQLRAEAAPVAAGHADRLLAGKKHSADFGIA